MGTGSCVAIPLTALCPLPSLHVVQARPRPALWLVGAGTSASPMGAAGGTLGALLGPHDPDELVRAAQQGDEAAFAELFRQHRAAVTRIVFRMLGRSADLEDVVQEVFFQVFRSLPDFRGQAKFTTWLHRVAVNVVLMTRRRARSRPVLAPEDAARAETSGESNPPDEELARGRRLAAFRRIMDRLSEKKRTVFVLHELEGLSPAEIAELVDCPVLTVRTRLFYARRDLAQMMRAEPVLAALAADWAETEASSATAKPRPTDQSEQAPPPDADDESSPEAS